MNVFISFTIRPNIVFNINLKLENNPAQEIAVSIYVEHLQILKMQ